MKLYYRVLGLLLCLACGIAKAQVGNSNAAGKWADSVLATLSPEERIAQLMVIRTSAPGKEGKAIFYDSLTDVLVKQYNIGGVCLFQGTPFEQAALLNRIQGMAKTPIMVTVDGEWGLGMRFAGVKSFPYQLTMGAAADADLTYRVGRAIAAQCRRMNIHVNYAPVVDVNNNPLNPVIGYRSFGESREKVALLGTRIMKGLQDYGVMACAKHFPGHGDVSVDSHYDLPVIQKTRTQLDSLELYPFRDLFANGVGSVMVAHLSIPAIDAGQNRPTSLSYQNITGLMREKLGYQGLTFTDALEMKGVAKFFPGGEAAIESLAAGNDMLCLPADVPQTIAEIKVAIEKGRLTWEQINEKCRKVLLAKYDYVWQKTQRIDTTGLLADLNGEVAIVRRETAEKAFTLVEKAADFAPVGKQAADVWVLQVGGKAAGTFATAMADRGAKVALYSEADTALLLQQASNRRYKKVVVSLQQLGRNPATNFGLNNACLRLLHQIANRPGSILIVQGNPYALGALQKAAFKTIAVGYEDDAIFQQTAFDWITGLFKPLGKLPVSVGRWKMGEAVTVQGALPKANPQQLGMRPEVLQRIDEVARQGIDSAAFPGCVVTVLRKGQLVFSKAYGYTTYDKETPLSTNTIFDLASVSKISATTLAIMHLYEQGKLNLQATLGSYLPAMRGTDKADITIESMLLHQSGLVSFIPFYRNVIDEAGNPQPRYFRDYARGKFKIPVTEKWYMNKRYLQTMYKAIAGSKLYDSLPRYVYSDNNFILLADVVKAITGQTIDRYVLENFYEPMGLLTTRYRILNHFDLSQVAPTENEKQFRQGLLWGYVHDPGAAMMGNIAGHAGLFSNATDLALLYQMLLNGGSLNGRQYLKSETISLFTGYRSEVSRRGYGFDKPEKNNGTLPMSKKYPASLVSPQTFGHTGYTGTCVWADPANELVYVFLSNRVHPMGGDNRKLLTLNIRGRIHDLIYQSLQP